MILHCFLHTLQGSSRIVVKTKILRSKRRTFIASFFRFARNMVLYHLGEYNFCCILMSVLSIRLHWINILKFVITISYQCTGYWLTYWSSKSYKLLSFLQESKILWPSINNGRCRTDSFEVNSWWCEGTQKREYGGRHEGISWQTLFTSCGVYRGLCCLCLDLWTSWFRRCVARAVSSSRVQLVEPYVFRGLRDGHEIGWHSGATWTSI